MNIGYARISTTDQSPALQLDALDAAKCEKIFEETASGVRKDRPELSKALDFMRKGDTLVVWKLDRLARSLSQLIETIEMFDERGMHFRSLTEEINTKTAGGKLVFHMMGALAQFERDLIRERTMAGLVAARKDGRVGGRRKTLTEDDIKLAETMIRSGDYTVAGVAAHFSVARGTLYNHGISRELQDATRSRGRKR